MADATFALWPTEDLTNSDEVVFLYLYFPSRAVNESAGIYSFVRLKDRMTVVLTAFANGSKAPLTVIGKSKRPRTFPRHFNRARNQGPFYVQENAWNTQAL